MHLHAIRHQITLCLASLIAALTVACAADSPRGHSPVSTLVEQRASQQPAAVPRGVRASEAGHADSRPIASIDGQPIARGRIVDLLLRSHGPGILEQIIVLEAATTLAAERGLTITQADVDREYQLALGELTNPLASRSLQTIDRQEADRVLQAVLAERNISRQEFLLGMRRNAFLRKLVDLDCEITEADLHDEYARAYGERVEVRHIQTASLREATAILDELASGEDFAALAATRSANTATGRDGGLLKPFSRYDEDVPGLLRETAFALSPEQVSNPIRIGPWYHIVRLERRLPECQVSFDEVRDELRSRLRARWAPGAMQELYRKLFVEADVQIHDSVLHDAFFRRHPDRPRR